MISFICPFLAKLGTRYESELLEVTANYLVLLSPIAASFSIAVFFTIFWKRGVTSFVLSCVGIIWIGTAIYNAQYAAGPFPVLLQRWNIVIRPSLPMPVKEISE